MDRFARKVSSVFQPAPGLVPTGIEKNPVGRPQKLAEEDAVPLLPKRVASSTEVAELRAELASFKAELARWRGVLRARCLVAGA